MTIKEKCNKLEAKNLELSNYVGHHSQKMSNNQKENSIFKEVIAKKTNTKCLIKESKIFGIRIILKGNLDKRLERGAFFIFIFLR